MILPYKKTKNKYDKNNFFHFNIYIYKYSNFLTINDNFEKNVRKIKLKSLCCLVS